MRKPEDIKAEIEKVKKNQFLPEAVRNIKVQKLETELKNAGTTTPPAEKTKPAEKKPVKKAAPAKAAVKPAGESVYIEYLNKADNFKPAKKYFPSYDAAQKWGKKEFDTFNPDMIHYGEAPKKADKPTPKRVKTSSDDVKPKKVKPKYKKGSSVYCTSLKENVFIHEVNFDAETRTNTYMVGFMSGGQKIEEKGILESDLVPKKKTATKAAKEKKSKVTYQYKGKHIKELTEEDCDELRKDVAARRQKAAKAEKKSKSKPVIEKISGNVAQAVKQAIKNVSAADIKDNPKKEIDKMKLIAIEAKKFVSKIKSILGEDYNASAVKEEFKDIDALIKEIEKKYK